MQVKPVTDAKACPASSTVLPAGGFTLIEFLVTLTILGILLALAVPSFRNTLRNNRVTALGSELAGSLNVARSEAVKRAANVTVCKTADASAPAPACTSSGDWSSGWMVFVDEGVAGVVDGADLRLQVVQPDGSGASITGDTGFASQARFNSRGAAANGNGGVITICLDGLRRDVAVNATGRVKVSPGAC